ncbi:Glucan 1,3-beta-glucosidase [Scedosporium apiospermum]|uniref:Glucan 1,3-beta-glucosidase n=1 Tax=Pseudallescheria apiosperma TaxID=563466 RepID=A0A084FW83_PSEDA|nr:Glucan 1,3-beta-glucosidase [Scedosporium apiospermum]KEZ39345.1 Glucan 1,3-beta-glucosidase [Scedosporium apiospermum]
MRLSTSLFWAATLAVRGVAAYWLEDIAHQGKAPYHSDPEYKVFRNVKDFGAVGDGVTDDTEAINLAISSGGRCAPQECKQSTTSPAVVYFPPGTYLVSNSIIDYYYTQIIGDPTDRPVIKASANFPTTTTLGVIDGNRYGADGLAWIAVNVFFRQLHNIIIDTTAIPASADAVGLHWPSSQATSLTNVEFRLSSAPGTKHVGMLIEEGSGGLLNDLVFRGGSIGARLGNQQYTARNLQFYGCQTAISQLWDWGWTYKSLVVEDCEVGIDVVDTNTASLTILDSEFTRVGEAIRTKRDGDNTTPKAAGSLVLENVSFDTVTTILTGPKGVVIPGDSAGQTWIEGYADGHLYDYKGPKVYTGSDSKYFPRPAALLDGDKYYEKSKPTYADVPASKFVSVRTFGASGDGLQDATAALNDLFAHVAGTDLVAFIDAGTYVVTDTVTIPAGARIVGEALASVIVGAGPKFSDINKPRAVIRVGNAGDKGRVEWSDTIVSTRGATAGAKLIEWNLYSPGEPSGMWDVHVRIGGFAGTDLQLSQCPTTPTESNVVNEECIAAYISLHVTKSAGGLYNENCWVWVADHDLEDPNYTQITIFAGRGILVEAEKGRIFISGSGSEHHVLYQYQFVNTRDIYLAQIQSETPYYQPNPPASVPFPPVSSLQDPDFAKSCAGVPAGVPCEMAWGLRVIGSKDLVIFGAGLYSFFNNYSTDCCQPTSGTECQQRIFEVVGSKSIRKRGSCGHGHGGHGHNGTHPSPGHNGTHPSPGGTTRLNTYNLNTIGTVRMITRYGEDIAFASNNTAGFVDTIAVYHDA